MGIIGRTRELGRHHATDGIAEHLHRADEHREEEQHRRREEVVAAIDEAVQHAGGLELVHQLADDGNRVRHSLSFDSRSCRGT